MQCHQELFVLISQIGKQDYVYKYTQILFSLFSNAYFKYNIYIYNVYIWRYVRVVDYVRYVCVSKKLRIDEAISCRIPLWLWYSNSACPFLGRPPFLTPDPCASFTPGAVASEESRLPHKTLCCSKYTMIRAKGRTGIWTPLNKLHSHCFMRFYCWWRARKSVKVQIG